MTELLMGILILGGCVYTLVGYLALVEMHFNKEI